MKRVSQFLFVGLGALGLSACGSADDASADAQADTVEMPAEAALEGLNDEPVEDADALIEEADSGPSESEASTAADDAADVAAAAEAAAAEPDVEE